MRFRGGLSGRSCAGRHLPERGACYRKPRPQPVPRQLSEALFRVVKPRGENATCLGGGVANSPRRPADASRSSGRRKRFARNALRDPCPPDASTWLAGCIRIRIAMLLDFSRRRRRAGRATARSSGGTPAMRLAAVLLAMLFLAGWAACTVPEPFDRTAATPAAESPWRRTVDGWERVDSWHPPSHAGPPIPHPATIALWQVLAAATIGVASVPSGSKVHTR